MKTKGRRQMAPFCCFYFTLCYNCYITFKMTCCNLFFLQILLAGRLIAAYKRRQKLLSACISMWAESHKICKVWSHKKQILTRHMASLEFIGPPKILAPPRPKFKSPLDTKAQAPPLIYLVGFLAISDPHINICVGPPTPALL